MIFHDITVTGQGDRRSARTHDSARLVRAAIDVLAGMLWRGGRAFRAPVAHPAAHHVELQWTQAGEPDGPALPAALATFWTGGLPLSTSALCAGVDAAADREALAQLQRGVIVALLRDTGLEPAFDALAVSERPVIVSVPLPPGAIDPEAMALVADLETCLAAAFFERAAGKGRRP